ncbi:MAG: replication-relaxation family protein [Leucobacter sp.]
MHLYGNRRSAIRQTSRHLRELHRRNFLVRLERRVGGWQGGSQVSIWTLSTKGMRHINGSTKRVRPHHHTTTFLHHHLAVTETRVVLHEASRRFQRELDVQVEPNCWRRYPSSSGVTTTLKPDLAATITSDDYVDRYFIEVDRDTENPARVITKCWHYLRYQRSGLEQREYGVYPAVVWLVPREARKQQLVKAIISEPGLPRDLFTVITLAELHLLVRDGPSQAA